MGHFSIKLIGGLIVSLFAQAFFVESDPQFETIHTLIYNDINEEEIVNSLNGFNWLENRIASKTIDLNSIYQAKAFTQKLADNSKIKRYQKSYSTWIEERTCPESPYIERPIRSRMTSRYGRRVHPVSGRSHVHAGIDFKGTTGTPVYASSPGVVKSVKRKGAYGKTIEIDHGNSFTTLYGHLSGYAVKKGQWVNLGQTIGYIGRTGRVTGPHLHFEVRCHNVPLNPRKYLGKMGRVAEVRFRRRARSFRTPSHRRQPSFVKRDPNYYTRMINLQKLKKLGKAAKKF